eukprot:c24686_g1_i7 orf=955-2226(-)
MLDFGPGSFFLTPEQLDDSPSARHGISSSTEKALRLYACEIIQEAGILLRLPQAVAATAQVLFHRFFCKQSFRDFDARSAAASCFWLAMKLEEEDGASNRGNKPSQLNNVVSMFENIKARREGDLPLPPHAPAFKIRKEELLKLETRILVELGFVCHVEHPHKLLLGYLNCLEASKEFIQEAWNLVNDSLRTTLCVSFSSNVIACGIIYATARRLSVPLPESPPWWLVFDVTLDQNLKVCDVLADLYRQPKSQYIDVRVLTPKPLEVASSSSEASSVASPVKSLDSEPPHYVTHCRNDVRAISSSSTSKILNSCFMNAPGLLSSKGLFVGDTAPGHRAQPSESKKRSRGSPDEPERKSRRPSSHERTRDRMVTRRDYRDAEASHRDAYREPEQKHRRQGDYSRCSSCWTSRPLVTLEGFWEVW